jgi:hypothetical protein
MVIPATAYQSRLLWALGDDGAEELALGLVEVCRQQPLGISHDWFPEIAVVLSGLDHPAELETVAESVSTPTPWRDAGLALGRGDTLAAAEIFRRIRARPLEAEALVLAAKTGLDADLGAAIEFFEEVGASADLAEAESLLARTRSA